MSVVVRFAILPPTRILNLTSPRYLPEISRAWNGSLDWHHPRYEPLRDIMERMYVDGFNEASGHYERLEERVRSEGFRNPVMVSAGGLDARDPNEIPPEWRSERLIACEYLGGSRLWTARRLGLEVPCIVNDHADVLPGAEALTSEAEILAKFTDRPASFQLSERGVTLNNLPYTHLPEAERYTVAEQSVIRRGIIEEIKDAVRGWLDAHD